MFMLIDKHKRIRGLYDGTETEDVTRLMEEIRMLKKEEDKELAAREQK